MRLSFLSTTSKRAFIVSPSSSTCVESWAIWSLRQLVGVFSGSCDGPEERPLASPAALARSWISVTLDSAAPMKLPVAIRDPSCTTPATQFVAALAIATVALATVLTCLASSGSPLVAMKSATIPASALPWSSVAFVAATLASTALRSSSPAFQKAAFFACRRSPETPSASEATFAVAWAAAVFVVFSCAAAAALATSSAVRTLATQSSRRGASSACPSSCADRSASMRATTCSGSPLTQRV